MEIPRHIQKFIKTRKSMPQRHPVKIMEKIICDYFASRGFKIFHPENPIVSAEENFDNLLIPKDHPCRNECFWVGDNKLLRTHTSAYQIPYLQAGNKKFIVIGDVFRKDTIDRTHHICFGQVEGVCVCEDPNEVSGSPPQANPMNSLTYELNQFLSYLFPGMEIISRPDHFPFTDPSIEFDVIRNGEEIEVLGAGVVRREIMDRAGITGDAWAFGIGIDRLAMLLFGIPTIKHLWCMDPKFLNQFHEGEITKFVPYSSLPSAKFSLALGVQYDNEQTRNKIHEILGDFGKLKTASGFIEKRNSFELIYEIIIPALPDETNPAIHRKRALEIVKNFTQELAKNNIIAH